MHQSTGQGYAVYPHGNHWVLAEVPHARSGSRWAGVLNNIYHDPNGHEVICQGMSDDLHHRLCRYASATLMLLSQHHRTIIIRSSCGSPSARCNVSYWPATNGLRHTLRHQIPPARCPTEILRRSGSSDHWVYCGFEYLHIDYLVGGLEPWNLD